MLIENVGKYMLPVSTTCFSYNTCSSDSCSVETPCSLSLIKFALCLPVGLCCGWLRWAEPPEQCGVLRLFLQPLDWGGSHERGGQLSSCGQLCWQTLCHRRRTWRRYLFRQGGQQLCASAYHTLKHIVMTEEVLVFSNNLFPVIIP